MRACHADDEGSGYAFQAVADKNPVDVYSLRKLGCQYGEHLTEKRTTGVGNHEFLPSIPVRERTNLWAYDSREYTGAQAGV